jgi:hypothetical protein
MEQRLKGQAPGGGAPANVSSSTATVQSSGVDTRPPIPEKDHPVDRTREQPQQQQYKYGSRPGTARQNQPAVPGALPPTPAGSEGEYEPSVVPSSRIASRPSGTPAQSHLGAIYTIRSAHASQTSVTTNTLAVTGGDADSIRSMSESATFADYVIGPEPDGDRERQA